MEEKSGAKCFWLFLLYRKLRRISYKAKKNSSPFGIRGMRSFVSDKKCYSDWVQPVSEDQEMDKDPLL